MNKYFASIALLVALLVAAPAKADVLGSFGFDPELYELVPVLSYSWNGETATVTADASVWSVVLDTKVMDLSGLDMGEMYVPGMTVNIVDPSKLAKYSAFFFGYGNSDVYDSASVAYASWLGLEAVVSSLGDLDDTVKGILAMLPPFVPLGEVAYGGVGEMLSGLGLEWYGAEDDVYGYLYIPELTGALKSGGDLSVEFFFNDLFLGGEGAPAEGFSFALYGVVARGGETDVPEPATLALMGLGLAGLGLARRRMKK